VADDPTRSFDPERLGSLECRAWVAYYRREWWALLRASVGMVRVGFRMPWPRTLWGAWLVLRANQLWAPVPDNDPDGARRCMARVYGLVSRTRGAPLDVVEAARREVEWWRAHRAVQRGPDAERADRRAELTEALAALYAFVYDVADETVTAAAELRARAMDESDRWVADGADPASPLVADERRLLVESYTALRDAVRVDPG
jgi:hypothetical protein